MTSQEYSIFEHGVLEINGLFNRLVTTLVVHYLMKSYFTFDLQNGYHEMTKLTEVKMVMLVVNPTFYFSDVKNQCWSCT